MQELKNKLAHSRFTDADSSMLASMREKEIARRGADGDHSLDEGHAKHPVCDFWFVNLVILP